MTDWDATAYYRLAEPQLAWGRAVLAGIALAGDETVIDAGCGTGRLTAEVAARLPRGRVVALDRSARMLSTARGQLDAARAAGRAAPGAAGTASHAVGSRVWLVRAAVESLPFRNVADLIVSTATFHWVLDHARLFASIFTALRPGGRLVAQCGGGPNLERALRTASLLMSAPPYAPFFADWSDPRQYADEGQTAARLRAAGFVEVAASLEAAPTTFADAASYREFLAAIILREHLARLPEKALQEAFLDAVVAQAAADTPPLTLDYWRLNIRARKYGNDE